MKKVGSKMKNERNELFLFEIGNVLGLICCVLAHMALSYNGGSEKELIGNGFLLDGCIFALLFIVGFVLIRKMKTKNENDGSGASGSAASEE